MIEDDKLVMIRVSEDARLAIKVLAAQRRESMSEVVDLLLARYRDTGSWAASQDSGTTVKDRNC
jgi:hypothetical protein